MTLLNLTLSSDGRPVGDALAASFRMDVEREVGAVQANRPADPGAKGVADIATIAVAILGSQAIAHLVGILKSYFERDQSLEVEVAGAGWKVRISGASARQMSAFDLHALIDRAAGGNEGERADAPGDSGRV